MPTLDLLEGFDDGMSTSRLPISNTQPLISTSYGRHGKGARVGDVSNAGYWIPHANPFLVGFNFYIQTVGGGNMIRYLGIDDWDNKMYYDSSGRQVCYAGRNGTTICTGIGSVEPQEWHYLEFLLYINTSNAGYHKFWLDGSLVAEATNQDSYRGPKSSFELGGPDSGMVDEMWIDDLYLLSGVDVNTSPLGSIEVKTVFPNGNGNYSDLTGSDGDSTDNYLMVDEGDPPDGDTTYVTSETEGDKDTYAFQDLSLGASDIVKAVNVSAWARKSDSAEKYLQVVSRISSTDYKSSSLPLTETYAAKQQLSLVSPATAAAWTGSEIDGAEFGIELRDS